MRLVVYVPDGRPYPYVLTPECLQPSLACEHEYGRMQRRGVVTLDEALMPAIAHSISPDSDYEYVIYSGFGRTTVEALMEPLGLSEPPCALV